MIHIYFSVSEKVKENEAVKLIVMKDGLLKLTNAYLTLSHKCATIFEAQRDIVKCLPDVEDKVSCQFFQESSFTRKTYFLLLFICDDFTDSVSFF